MPAFLGWRTKHAVLHRFFACGSLLSHFHVASLGFGAVFGRTLCLSCYLALRSLCNHCFELLLKFYVSGYKVNIISNFTYRFGHHPTLIELRVPRLPFVLVSPMDCPQVACSYFIVINFDGY